MILMPLALALPLAMVTSNTDFHVVEVHRSVSFAGKLGNRVEDVLIVSRDGQQYTLELGRAHTRFGALTEFRAGETVTLKGVRLGGHIFALRSDVAKR